MSRWPLGMLGVIGLAQVSMIVVFLGYPLTGFTLSLLAGSAGGLYAARADAAASRK